MTDETTDVTADRTAARAVEALTAVFGEASPATVFSAPEVVGDELIITAVAWERAGGFGFGGGGDTDGSGMGAGGGGSSQGRPVAVVRVGSQGVEVNPVVDLTKIAVTVALGLVGVWRALRHSSRR